MQIVVKVHKIDENEISGVPSGEIHLRDHKPVCKKMKKRKKSSRKEKQCSLHSCASE